jgi:hypothetical protein
MLDTLLLEKSSWWSGNCWRDSTRQLGSILGPAAMFVYLILAGGLEVRAIAQAISPENLSSEFFKVEFDWIGETLNTIEHLELKSEARGDRTPPAPAPADAIKSLPEGIYLYGESPRPEEVQKEYFVFEVRRGKVVGAFYLPRSAFYCFYGNLESTQLNVTVVDSFDRTTSPYSVNLQKYYPISAVSDNDRRILGICKEAHSQETGWETGK